jgi:hypothetical protein
MPYQILLKRKGSATFTNASPVRPSDDAPNLGEVVQCRINGQIVRAKVTAIEPSTVGAQIGQNSRFYSCGGNLTPGAHFLARFAPMSLSANRIPLVISPF